MKSMDCGNLEHTPTGVSIDSEGLETAVIVVSMSRFGFDRMLPEAPDMIQIH